MQSKESKYIFSQYCIHNKNDSVNGQFLLEEYREHNNFPAQVSEPAARSFGFHPKLNQLKTWNARPNDMQYYDNPTTVVLLLVYATIVFQAFSFVWCFNIRCCFVATDPSTTTTFALLVECQENKHSFNQRNNKQKCVCVTWLSGLVSSS
jgi:hypothetical protein